MQDIYCAIPTIGRRGRTDFLDMTLQTLGQCHGSDRLAVHLILTHSPHEGKYAGSGLRIKDLKDKALRAGLTVVKATYLDEKAVPKLGFLGWLKAHQLACDTFDAGKWPWFWWVEDDLLFNPDTIDGIFHLYDEASKTVKVGGINPYQLIGHREYKNLPTTDREPFLKRSIVITPGMFLSREAMAEQDISIRYNLKNWRSEYSWGRHLYRRGFIHLVPKVSLCQSVLRLGITGNKTRWYRHGRGGIGFVPHRSVRLWWEWFNRKEVGTPRDPGIQEECDE